MIKGLTECPVCGAGTLHPAPGGLCAKCAFGRYEHMLPSRIKAVKAARRKYGLRMRQRHSWYLGPVGGA